MSLKATPPTASSTDPVAAFAEAPTARGKYRARQKTGRGFQSSEPLPSNRRWRFPSIKRNNFGFFDPMVFNGIGDFRWRKGCVSAALTWMAGHWAPVHRGSDRGQGTPGPGREMPGGGTKSRGAFSQQPALAPSFIANTDFSFSRAR